MTTLVQLRDRFLVPTKRIVCQGCFRTLWVHPNTISIGLCRRCPESNGWVRIEQDVFRLCRESECCMGADYAYRDDIESTDDGLLPRLLCIGHARGHEWVREQARKATG